MAEVVKQVFVKENDEYVVNVGPQHPSTHGVLRFEVTLNGETVYLLFDTIRLKPGKNDIEIRVNTF